MIGQIGKLDTRITLQRPTPSVDAQGSSTNSWAGLATVWAESKAIESGEVTAGNERTATRDYTFKIRYQSALATLAATDRVVWRGSNFDILSAVPLPEGRPDQILITARRRA